MRTESEEERGREGERETDRGGVHFICIYFPVPDHCHDQPERVTG